MFDLSRHPLFREWCDPVSGQRSYVLTERVAPIQQSFYFTNPGISADERWCWLYCAFPPSPARTLGVVSLDPDNPVIRHFPASQFEDASPMVSPEGDGVYFTQQLGSGDERTAAVWKMGMDGRPAVVALCDPDWLGNRTIDRLSTHLSMSADKRYLLLDGRIGRRWFVALADLQEGTIRPLHHFAQKYNHALFSPDDPELFLIAQDWRFSSEGTVLDLDHRTWIMDTRKTFFRPIRPDLWYGHGARPTHEWWSAPGKIAWVDYDEGVFEWDRTSGRTEHIWPGPKCHAHCDPTRRRWCADQSPYEWPGKPCELLLLDRESGRETHIVKAMPPPPVPRKWYHLDPHPQFSPKGTWVCYTTTVMGTVDVALHPVPERL
jgi:hypothetical protein